MTDEHRKLAEEWRVKLLNEMSMERHVSELDRDLAEWISDFERKVRLEEAKWWDRTWGARLKAKTRANRIIELERGAASKA